MAIKFETFRGTASGVTGGLVYKGSYNATTSTPSLVTAQKGDFYIVSVAGTLAGVTLNVGDHIVFNQNAADPVTSAMFDVIDNTDAVASVNGQTGVVVLDSDDVSEGSSNLYFTNTRADGRISAADLTDLNDVNYTAGAGIDGYVLKYVDSNSRWEAQAETGGSPTLQNVTDNGSTTTTNISTAQITLGGDLLADGDQTRTIGSETNRFVTTHGNLNGAVRFKAKASEAISKGDVLYIDGVSGTVPTVSKAQANSAATMPAFGLAYASASVNAEVQVVTLGNLEGIGTGSFAAGDTLFVSSTTAGGLENTAPTGESSLIQNIAKVVRAHGSSGVYKVGGAGRTNATPNLDTDKIFLGNASNQAVPTALSSVNLSSFNKDLDTDDVSEGSTNLYYTNARFDTQLGTKTTDNVTEGSSNLYFTNTRADGRISAANLTDLNDVNYTAGAGIDGYVLEYVHANNRWEAKVAATAPVTSVNTQTGAVVLDTDDVSEGSSNLYYTNARFDTQLGTKTTDNVTEGSSNLYFTNTRADGRISAADLTDLNDVNYTAGAGIDGYVLKYVNSNNRWEAQAESSGGGGFTYTAITSASSPVTGAVDTHYSADTSGGAITINLPALAAGNAGKEIRVKLKTAGNTLTLDGNLSETIDGSTTYTLTVQNQAVTLVSDGSGNWEVI